jgi:CopG family nickel-responsive transcriptional regulator
MSGLYRFGVSLDRKLIERFDAHIRARSYQTRSEAIRDLIREELVRREWSRGGEVAGAITVIYDHHKRELVNRLMDIQHDFGDTIISTQHVHLDHHNCLEMIAARGNASKVQELARSLKAQKGVKHLALNMSSTGKDLH